MKHALVAQLVEQRFCKPKVAGSSPAGGTRNTSEIVPRRPETLEKSRVLAFFLSGVVRSGALTSGGKWGHAPNAPEVFKGLY